MARKSQAGRGGRSAARARNPDQPGRLSPTAGADRRVPRLHGHHGLARRQPRDLRRPGPDRRQRRLEAERAGEGGPPRPVDRGLRHRQARAARAGRPARRRQRPAVQRAAPDRERRRAAEAGEAPGGETTRSASRAASPPPRKRRWSRCCSVCSRNTGRFSPPPPRVSLRSTRATVRGSVARICVARVERSETRGRSRLTV